MRRLRVLHILSGYLPDQVTGTAQRVRGLMLPLVQSDRCEVHVLRPRPDSANHAAHRHEVVEGVHVHQVEGNRVSPGALRRVLREGDFDLVHYHSLRDYAIGVLSARRLPSVTEVHTLWHTRPPKKAVYSWMYRRCRKVVVLAPTMWEAMRARYGLPQHRMVLVPNGVDAELFRPQPEEGQRARKELGIKERYVVGFAGAFQRWQGLDTLLEAFITVISRGLDVHLLLTGDGPLRPLLEERIDSLGVRKQVTITGFVPQATVARYMSCMDVFAMPRPSSLEAETALPLKALEAMAAGRAVVASRVAGLTSVIQDGDTGRLAPPGDAAALADAMKELLTDEAARLRLGDAARQYVIESFNWERSADILYGAYRQAVSVLGE